MSIKIVNIGEANLPEFSEKEARAAMLACGFTDETIEAGMEILAAYDRRGGVTEVVVFSVVGDYAGNNADGWNTTNSLFEIGGWDAAEIEKNFGEDALEAQIWQAYLARIASEA